MADDDNDKVTDAGSREILALLRRPVEAMEARGIVRSSGESLGVFLGRLVDGGLLSDQGVKEFLDAYQRIRFGGREVSDARVGDVVGELLEEIEQLDERAVKRLPTPAAHREKRRAERRPVRIAKKPPEKGRTRYLDRLAGRLSARSVAAVVAWTVGMLAAGYLLEDRIDGLVDLFEDWIDPETVEEPRLPVTMKQLRAAALAAPGEAGPWLRLAHRATREGRHAEAMVAYGRVIAIDPGHSEALNNLAWLHCTAADPFFRNPVRALELARRAHEIDPAPHITDTLAEAYYLNGDPERAVALERDALSRAKRGRRFFTEQLAKFERALAVQRDAGI